MLLEVSLNALLNLISIWSYKTFAASTCNGKKYDGIFFYLTYITKNEKYYGQKNEWDTKAQMLIYISGKIEIIPCFCKIGLLMLGWTTEIECNLSSTKRPIVYFVNELALHMGVGLNPFMIYSSLEGY